MGAKLGVEQRKQIEDAIVDLQKLIPYMKNKIKPFEDLEEIQLKDQSHIVES